MSLDSSFNNYYMNKICSLCNDQKALEEFYKHPKGIQGVSNKCKECCKSLGKLRYRKNRQPILEKRKIYRQKNKTKIKKYHKQYSTKNRLRLKERAKLYNIKNRDRIAQTSHEYYLKNKDSIRTKKYKRHKERLKKDPLYKLANAIRRRTYYALRSKKLHKTNHMSEYLGCPIKKLKEHLEERFQSGMTWKNHGKGKNKWTIDHIIPLSSAQNTEELYKLCHYSNLQPLWYLENLRKNAKIL